MSFESFRAAALTGLPEARTQLLHEVVHPITVGLKGRIGRADVAFEGHHRPDRRVARAGGKSDIARLWHGRLRALLPRGPRFRATRNCSYIERSGDLSSIKLIQNVLFTYSY